MNIDELRAAATVCRNAYTIASGPNVLRCANFTHLMTDPEPVTAEWLRDVWGAEIENRTEEWVAVFEQTWEDKAALFVYSDGTVLAQNMGHTARLNKATTRGQFTALMFGLGQYPKGDGE